MIHEPLSPRLLDGLVHRHAPDELRDVLHLPRGVLDHRAHVHDVRGLQILPLLQLLRRVDALVVSRPPVSSTNLETH